MDRASLLKKVPLFDILNPQEFEEVSEAFKKVSVLKGDTVCREGDEGDSLFVILSGELDVLGGKQGKERVINRMGPGDFFGEITLLTGGKRSATVKAAMDAVLFVLEREDFERVFLQNPKALEYLARVLAQRLARLSRGVLAPRAATVVGVVGPKRLKGKTLTASALAGLLQSFSGRKAVHVMFYLYRKQGKCSSGRVRLRIGASGSGNDQAGRYVSQLGEGSVLLEVAVEAKLGKHGIREAIGKLIQDLKDGFPFIVLDPCAGSGSLSSSVAQVSDCLVCLQDSEDPNTEEQAGPEPRVFRVINRFNQGSAPVPISHMEPFVLPEDKALESMGPAEQGLYVQRSPCAPVARPLHRLARKILGTSVGLALGGGAAFGIAHVGVIRVLEEHQIPIDLVAGTSMGSIIALAYAAGLGGVDMERIAHRIGTKRTVMSALDFTVSGQGFLRGDALVRIFSPLLKGVETFDQLVLPCRAVATDIETGERITIRSGRVDRAFRASSSITMVMSPVMHEGRVLVDGAVVDPVPAGVVKEMGADICIAVNVVPPLVKGQESFLSRIFRQAKRLNPLHYFSGEKAFPSLFDIIMNAQQASQYELGNFKAISADVLINPDLRGYSWMDFYKPAELIRKGEEASERALPKILRVLKERQADGAGP